MFKKWLEAEKIALTDLLYITLEIYNILVYHDTNFLALYVHTSVIQAGAGQTGTGC